MATFKAYFGFGSTWTTADASISWTEVTNYVLTERSVSSSRGRSSELDDHRAGTVSLVLTNSDRRFDPTYAAGPYYGNLKPGVPVKLEAVANSTTYPLFRGFVEGWPQDYDVSNRLGVVNVKAIDGFAKLATAATPSSVYAIEVATDEPTAWWRLAETAGTSMADSSGNGHDGVWSDPSRIKPVRSPNRWETVGGMQFARELYGHTDDRLISAQPYTLEALIEFGTPFDWLSVASSFPSIVMGGGGDLDYYMTAYATDASGAYDVPVLQLELVDFNIGLNYVSGALSTDPPSSQPHHLAMRVETGTVSIYIDGELFDDYSTTGPLITLGASGTYVAGSGKHTLSFDGILADVAVYAFDLGSTRIADHAEAFSAPWDDDTTGERIDRILDIVGWPSDLIDTATGYSILGPAVLGKNALPLLKSYEKAEQGRLFIARDGALTFLDRYYHQLVTEGTMSQATFSDDGTDNLYSAIAFDYDDRLVYNRVRGSRSGGSTIEVSDQTSIDTYGEQVDSSLDGIDLTDDDSLRGLLELRLDRYKDPQLRTRPVEVRLPRLTAAQQADVLALELGHRVTIERTPQGVGSAITQETVVEGISHRVTGDQWAVVFTLSPVDTREYFILDSSLLDGSDVLGA